MHDLLVCLFICGLDSVVPTCRSAPIWNDGDSFREQESGSMTQAGCSDGNVIKSHPLPGSVFLMGQQFQVGES